MDSYPDTGKDLATAMTGPKQEDRAALKEKTGSPDRHSRAQCPTCRARGIEVDRVRTVAVAVV